jgi:hypothetical protein
MHYRLADVDDAGVRRVVEAALDAASTIAAVKSDTRRRRQHVDCC